MTLQEFITQSIDLAIAGSDPDASILQKYTLEAQSLVDPVLEQLTAEVRGSARLRARCMKQFSIALTSGVGSIPATLMVQYIGEGSVRDSDSGASNGIGNYLSRVLHENDFIALPAPYLFGYYWIGADTSGATVIKTRQIITGSLTDTVGDLVVVAPRTPTKAQISELDSEVTDRGLELMAMRLRGIMPGVEAAA